MNLAKNTQQLAAKNFRANMVNKTFKHIDGQIYVVDNVVVNATNNSLNVVYHNIEDDSIVWSIDLDIFLAPLDRSKYPDVDALYTFESIELD